MYLALRRLLVPLFLLFSLPATALASEGGSNLDLTTTWFGIAAIITFVLAYALVVGEEFLHLRKSKPVIVAAGIIWILVGMAYAGHGDTETAANAIRHNLLEYTELFLFLLAAMTYINTMEERQVFNALRAWLVSRGFTLRAVFWITGLLAFFISPVADNLTTALLMAAVVMAVGAGKPKFVALACVNIVVAANAGGAFSPFGDITTLMVWQKGIVDFWNFFHLFIPSMVNWLVPAIIMSLVIESGKPDAMSEKVEIKRGGFIIIGLFMLTITLAVSLHNFLHLPPVLGMMTGLGILKFFGYYLRQRDLQQQEKDIQGPETSSMEVSRERNNHFDIFGIIARAEWDTLMFFYGVVLCVGGLGTHPRLPGTGLRIDVYRAGSNLGQHPGRYPLGHRRQHPGDVRRTDHEPGDGSDPVAAGYAHRRCRRLAALYRFCRRCRPHGSGTRHLYLLFPPQMELGDSLRLRGKHLGTPAA